MIYITTAATYTLGKAFGIRLTINQTTTGTVTINDGPTPVGIIAAATTGGTRDYWGFTNAVSVVTASAENITVNTLNRQP